MISQPQSHRRRAVMIARAPATNKQPQGTMGSMEIVIEDLQVHEPIPGGIAFSERMRLASEGIEPIAQRPIEPLHMHGAGWSHPRPQRSADLHRQETSVFIAMLDRLRQRDGGRYHQGWSPPLACRCWLPINSPENGGIAMPAIAEPAERASLSPLEGGRDGLFNEVLAQWAAGTGNHEPTRPILDQASPAFPLVGQGGGPVFFCTNDQNSSISTWLRCRSLASTWVRAWA